MTDKTEYIIFRSNLCKLRATSGLNGEELATKLGMTSKKRISDLECGKVVPKLSEVLGIAKLFNLTLDDLVYKEITIKIIVAP